MTNKTINVHVVIRSRNSDSVIVRDVQIPQKHINSPKDITKAVFQSPEDFHTDGTSIWIPVDWCFQYHTKKYGCESLSSGRQIKKGWWMATIILSSDPEPGIEILTSLSVYR
jgi:hypothetical protein